MILVKWSFRKGCAKIVKCNGYLKASVRFLILHAYNNFYGSLKSLKFCRKAKNPENDLEESRQVDEISVATPAVVEEKKEPPQQQQQQQQPPPQLQTQTRVTTKVDAKTSKTKSTKIEASKLRRRKMGTGIGPDLPAIEGATKTGAKAKPTRQQSSNNQSRQAFFLFLKKHFQAFFLFLKKTIV